MVDAEEIQSQAAMMGLDLPLQDGTDPDAPAAPVEKVEYPDGENLVDKIPPETLKVWGATVVENEAADWESSAEHREKRVKHYNLFCGKLPSLSEYQKNILYVHMPYIAKAAILFHAKMHRNRFPASGEICGVDIQRPLQRPRARKLSRHLNLCLRKLVPEYIPEHDSGGLQTLLYGDGFSVFYHDAVNDRPGYEFCGSDDVVVPYTCKSKRADMADVPRITWKKRKYRHELEAEQDSGYYAKVDVLYPKKYDKTGLPEASAGGEDSEQRQGSVRQASDEVTGFKPSSDDKNAPRQILECDMMLVLPTQERQRPVTICVDLLTKTVLRVALREREDPQDAARYRRDMAAYQATVDADMEAHAAATEQWQQAAEAFAQGAPPAMDPMGLPMMDEQGMPVVGEPPVDPGEPPPPPPEPEMPRPARRVAFNRWTHFICIPNPEGFYNFGIGFLGEGPTVAANEIMSLCISLLRMSLLPTGFYSRMAKAPRGEFELTLGKMNESHLPPESLQKAFYTFAFPTPDVTGTMKMEERLSRSVQDITADEIIGGAPGLSGQTATETQERVANAMDSVSVINARYDRGRTNEVQNLVYILSQTLPDDGYTFYEVKHTEMPPQQPGMPAEEVEDADEYQVSREDYLEEFDVVFTTDPNVASQPQREARARKAFDAVMQIVTAAPGGVPALDPITGVLLVRAAGRQLLESMEFGDLAARLKTAPLPQQPGMPGQPGAEGEGDGEGIDGGGAAAPPGMGGAPMDAAPEGAIPPPS